MTAASSSSAGTLRRRRRRQSWWSEPQAPALAARTLLLSLTLLGLSACREPERAERAERVPTVSRFARTPAPERERSGQLCLDIGARRVCYGDAVVTNVPRTLPAGAVPPEGFRCGGSGSARSCEDRAARGGAFECGTTRCLQRQPRMPDDGEWECVEMSGLAFCHGRGPMAGVARGPRDLGWLCGPRRAGARDEEICVDADPDRPRDERYRQCRYEQRMGSSVRSCTFTRAALIGDPCTETSACPADSWCQAGLCLPARPVPGCWLDQDCDAHARCALGSCVPRGA